MSIDDDNERDYPNIGGRRDGRILVCMGDDKPDEWISWLEPLVSEFEKLADIAEEHELDLDAGSEYGKVEDWREFCNALGVSIDQEFWEGCFISGQFVTGWVTPGQTHSAKKTGKEILKRIRMNLLGQIRSPRIEELMRIESLDLLIEKTRDDREALLSKNSELQASLENAQKTTATLQQAFAEAKVNDTSALALDCLRIACAVINGDRRILTAGPLVLWSDGIVYAITSRGGVPLPAESAPQILINELARAGYSVVEVAEMTKIGHWKDGPHFRKGTTHISGWMNVWREVERCKRTFLAENPAKLALVHDVHEHFKTSPSSPQAETSQPHERQE